MKHYRNEKVPCPACGESGKMYWNFGHSSCTCPTCDGKKYITFESYLRREYAFAGHSENEIVTMINDFFK